MSQPKLGYTDVFPYGSGEAGLSQDQKDRLFDPRRMKRRCAACHTIIEGRPNKLYCSVACRKKADRHRKPSRKNGTDSGPVESVIEGTNGVLIAKVARLGYVGRPEDVVLDVTYGKGKFWTRYRPTHLVTHDLAIDGVDFCHLPEDDNSISVVCFDPPYISTGNRETSSVDDLYDRYGIGNLKGWRAIRKLIDDGLTDCARVLAPAGYLLVKCMDYVESGHKVWNTFHVAAYADSLGLHLVDRVHHKPGRGGPQPMTNLDGSPREQKTAREVSSMLLVFTK